MKMEGEWSISKGEYGPRMEMFGRWSTTAAEAARRFGVRELELNRAKGWNDTDVSFLPELSDFILSLTIMHWNIGDISPIHELRELRRIKIDTFCKTKFDFARFPLLESCTLLQWRPKARSLFEHTGVKDLFVYKYPDKDLTALKGMRSLRSLSITSQRIALLDGIEYHPELAFLGLYRATNLGSLSGVQHLHQLEGLEVMTCRKVRELSPLADLHQLKRLFLCNCGDIESLHPIADLSKLEEVVFTESTNILDGDLSVLEGLPLLRNMSYMNRSHYTHKREEFPAYFNKPVAR